jgi:phosphate/sulfate permease
MPRRAIHLGAALRKRLFDPSHPNATWIVDVLKIMSDQSTDSSSSPPWRLIIGQLAALAVGLAIVATRETARLMAAIDDGSPFSWFADMDIETTPFLLLLLVLPAFWMVRRPLLQRRRGGLGRFFSRLIHTEGSVQTAGRREWLLATFVAFSSVGISAWVAQRPVANRPGVVFGELPPAYHDEFSYLFQAKTFLAGRLSFPTHAEAPELFDQMHVLNDDGRFASRFFPGTGLWMAPFVAIERPVWGHWLAGGLSAFFIFWAGRELGGNGVGLLAGLLTALSPGMALFSNLLLAHHPGLVGLTLFLFAFLRMMRTPRWSWAFAAGCGLSFAMLCRPMTAAGFGLPFGVWFAWRLLRRDTLGDESVVAGKRLAVAARIQLAALMALPIAGGLAFQMFNNHAVTGSVWATPYQRYTDIYTPRHVYGFNNVLRGEQRLGSKVIENYDRWTENLAPRMWERNADGDVVLSLASRNVWNRLQASLRWSLAIVPLTMGVMFFVICGVGRSDGRWWLIVAAILALHIAHIPYWYEGIMQWHYVFETGPLWLLLFAGATQPLLQHWRATHRPLMPAWLALFVGVAWLTAFTSPEPFWSVARIDPKAIELTYSRRMYYDFHKRIARVVGERSALILVEHDPSLRHIDHVTNDPGLDADVLIGRFHAGRTELADVQMLFPDRTIYLYRAASGELIKWKRSD